MKAEADLSTHVRKETEKAARDAEAAEALKARDAAIAAQEKKWREQQSSKLATPQEVEKDLKIMVTVVTLAFLLIGLALATAG